MLPWPQSYLQTLVVRDVVVVVAADYCAHHFAIASEHLIKVPTLPMGLCATLDCWGKAVLHQRLTYPSNVVIEVATYDDGGMQVLSGDVLGDINDSFCSVLQLHLNTSSVMLPTP